MCVEKSLTAKAQRRQDREEISAVLDFSPAAGCPPSANMKKVEFWIFSAALCAFAPLR
jgi:hypothetical protein